MLNNTENSEVPAQTPPFKGAVKARTALFSVATVVDYGGEFGERVNSLNAWEFSKNRVYTLSEILTSQVTFTYLIGHTPY